MTGVTCVISPVQPQLSDQHSSIVSLYIRPSAQLIGDLGVISHIVSLQVKSLSPPRVEGGQAPLWCGLQLGPLKGAWYLEIINHLVQSNMLEFSHKCPSLPT